MEKSPVTTTLGTHLTRRRRELEIGQAEAARQVGVARSTWITWEKGKKFPADSNWVMIEKVFRWQTGSIAAIAKGGEPTELPLGTVAALGAHGKALPPDDDFVRELRAMSGISPAQLELLIHWYWEDRARNERRVQEKYRGIAKAAGS